MNPDMSLLGVDFTSAPCRHKPITVATGRFADGALHLLTLEDCVDWQAFDTLLRRPGPWLGAFDFPFGLPREAVIDLGWPDDWPSLVRHCRQIGRTSFRASLDAYRQTRPYGRRYAHRAVDSHAGSHSPLKLVNPPVGLMFLEGAPRLLDANISIPGMFAGDPTRNALEAYPGFLARSINTAPYKSDERAKQTPARHAARRQILDAVEAGTHMLSLPVRLTREQRQLLTDDARGDRLDALLALVQGAWAAIRGDRNFGLPAQFDPLEGWIAGVPSQC